MFGSHHFISQAGWKRCNLNILYSDPLSKRIYLSIFCQRVLLALWEKKGRYSMGFQWGARGAEVLESSRALEK